MAKESFKRIERHLFARQYTTQEGERRKLYYGVFRCRLKGKQRQIPLGSDPSDARVHLYELERRNIRREDFDLDKIKVEPTMEPERRTVEGYAPEFLKTKKKNRSPAVHVNVGHLVRLLRDTPLDEIDKDKINDYREWRRAETVTKRGVKVKSGDKIKDSTINKEINSLFNMLKTSAEETGAKVPSSNNLLTPEIGNQRDRILDEDEYKALLDVSPPWLRRLMVFANETAISQGDLLKLTWFEVHRKNPQASVIKLQGGRSKNGLKQMVPISPELHAVLDELAQERSKVKNDDGNTLVFTLHGKRIKRDKLRKPFVKARKAAKVENFTFHDFRHCACSRWVNADIEGYRNRLAMGHSRGSVNEGYTTITPEKQYKYFAERLGWNEVEFGRALDGGVGEEKRNVVTS